MFWRIALKECSKQNKFEKDLLRYHRAVNILVIEYVATTQSWSHSNHLRRKGHSTQMQFHAFSWKSKVSLNVFLDHFPSYHFGSLIEFGAHWLTSLSYQQVLKIFLDLLVLVPHTIPMLRLKVHTTMSNFWMWMLRIKTWVLVQQALNHLHTPEINLKNICGRTWSRDSNHLFISKN